MMFKSSTILYFVLREVYNLTKNVLSPVYFAMNNILSQQENLTFEIENFIYASECYVISVYQCIPSNFFKKWAESPKFYKNLQNLRTKTANLYTL